ncbi:MAG: endonuclease V [bacterium]|nr:endonuclease V [bacterium]
MAIDVATMRDLQYKVAAQVDLTCAFSSLHEIKTVAGADVSCDMFSRIGYAAVVVYSYPSLKRIEEAGVKRELDIPYIPGYLSFREGPLIHECLKKIKARPDVLICDGQGLAHPRRAGLACHIGVSEDLPTVGCAKSRLIGEYHALLDDRGERSELYDKNERIGVVLRSRSRVKPLFISPGHKMDIDFAADLVLSMCKFRLPEPIRAAHNYVNWLRKSDAS